MIYIKDQKITYGDIYKQFIEETGIDETKLDDYRPCCEMFDVPNIPYGIVIWLKTGGKLIYIYK